MQRNARSPELRTLMTATADRSSNPGRLSVLSPGLVAGFLAWDAGLDALCLERASEPVGVVAAVAEQPLRFW